LSACVKYLTALPRIVAANPYACYAKAATLLNPPPAVVPGIHPSAVVGEGARIAASQHRRAGGSGRRCADRQAAWARAA
jgi:UDP-3-O-[3-hydroxymyristoyl] glucosamine N-acyltransferase